MTSFESAENYLESILMIKQKKGYVRAIDIVNLLGFSKPSVSIAMKKLREQGLVVVSSDNNIELTEEGMRIATKVYDKHRLFTIALIKLGVPEKVAAVDACRMEHIVSEETIEAFKRFVNE